MKRITIILAVFAFAFAFTACEKENGRGALKLSITDSPVDSSSVSGVYITINDIMVHTYDSGWVSLENFEGPKIYNLLDLRRGVSAVLGSTILDAGNYTQIRFMLDATEKGSANHSNPGCYIKFTNGDSLPLFVPSGSQSGFKGTGEFTVPVNDTINITADFDVRRSVVKAGSSGKFILKPTIRLIVDNQAGSIRGNVTNIPEDSVIVVYAYAHGSYKEEEAEDPEEDSQRFPNAVSSDRVDESGIYHISFLAEGTYDLVVTSAGDGNFGEVIGLVENVNVFSLKTTTQNIDINLLK